MTPRNVIICASGISNHDNFVKLIDKHLSNIKGFNQVNLKRIFTYFLKRKSQN